MTSRHSSLRSGNEGEERLSHQLFYSAEDGGYSADVPDLKSCSAFGDTPEQALHEVLAVKLAWLAAAKKHKKPAPEPRYRPAIYAAAG